MQRLLGEEEIERIAHPVARDLQDALVHRKHHHARLAGGGDVDRNKRARAHHGRQLDRQRLRACRAIDREWRDAKCQRAHEYFIGRRIAQELHVDVTVALEVGRHADLLHRTGGIASEPGLGIHAVAFDGDQPATGVWRTHADLDRLAGLVPGLGQAERQFGISLQRSRQVCRTRDGIGDLVQHRAIHRTNFQNEAARLVGRQRKRLRRRGQVERAVLQGVATLVRHIAIQPGVLLGQHRDEALLHDHRMQASHRARLAIRADRQQLHAALVLALHVVQPIHGLDADQEIVAGNERAGLRGHVATAARLERACQEIELVGRLRVL